MVDQPAQKRSWAQALWRGFARHCPACGRGRLFAGFLKIADRCPCCGEELHHHRADDIPPYFTILIVGHIVVPLILGVEALWRPSLLLHMSIWIPTTLGLALLLLPSVKGGVVGLQWALRMGGFGHAAAQLMDS
jgi:uncharacterized protein (DUF983 family)